MTLTVQPLCIWKPMPTRLELNDPEIHVWRASLEEPPADERAWLETLSEDERLRAQRFHFERDRKRFVVGRGILRALLGRYLGGEPASVQFRYGDRGKPYLAGEMSESRLCFNVSHSQGLALYAFARGREIGIDLEFARSLPDAENIALRFFSPSEKAAFRALAPNEKEAAFFKCWTRKEAYVKAVGDGLAFPLHQFDVSVSPGEPAKLLTIKGCPEIAERWFLEDLTPAPDYAAAVAVEGSGWQLNCWQWPGLR